MANGCRRRIGGDGGIRDCEVDRVTEFLFHQPLPCFVAYNWGVNTLLQQFVAVATSLILALPPGSCSVFQPHDRDDSRPTTKCCHQTSPNTPCDSEKTPAQPSVKCCCVQDAPLPQKAVEPTDR